MLNQDKYSIFRIVQSNLKKKAAGPTSIVAELLKAAGEGCVRVVTPLINATIKEECIPRDWDTGYLVNLYKVKGDALLRGDYRGLLKVDGPCHESA